MWKTIHQLTNKKSKTAKINELIIDQKVTTNPDEIADGMKKYFKILDLFCQIISQSQMGIIILKLMSTLLNDNGLAAHPGNGFCCLSYFRRISKSNNFHSCIFEISEMTTHDTHAPAIIDALLNSLGDIFFGYFFRDIPCWLGDIFFSFVTI